jgi:ATP-dependent helicase/nuclease subunit B
MEPLKVYNIPATVSFVDALAQGILNRYGSTPMQLATLTVLLPNRRGCRALQDAFLRLSNGTPLLLPNIRAIGDVEEDALYLGASGADMDVPPAIAPLRRKLILAQYLTATRPDQFNTAQSLSMATQLGLFLDSVETEGLSLDQLDTLVPENYASHWQINLAFLKDVLRVFWPQHLASEGVIDAGARRRLLIEAYTQSLQNNPPHTPIIAAGSTGSIPATAALLKTVAELPQGCVVLPGLDTILENTHWSDAIEEGHPQAGLARLLLHFQITRSEVMPWDSTLKTTPRDILISTLMRPAQAMQDWTQKPLPPESFEGLTKL